MKKTLDSLGDIQGKRVFLRVDFNVPMENGRVSDDYRITKALNTINYLLDRRARLVVASHLGRPKGKVVPEMSLQAVAERLSQLLKKDVVFNRATVGPEARAAAEGLEDGEVYLLENLRFHPGEKAGDESFASQLRELGDVYVNDAFGTAHRRDSSVYLLPTLFEIKAAGLLLAKEVEVLSRIKSHPERPYAVLMGGAKIADKIRVLESLLDIADTVLIGGGMAYTFLKAMGQSVGQSLVDEQSIDWASQALDRWSDKLVLPVDHICKGTGSARRIPDDDAGFDIGPETVDLFKQRLSSAKTVFWNGPMGVFEQKGFERGTVEMALTLRNMVKTGTAVITGGGDTVAALHAAGVQDSEITHVSTGGGATLEFLAGADLPGLSVLPDA